MTLSGDFQGMFKNSRANAQRSSPSFGDDAARIEARSRIYVGSLCAVAIGVTVALGFARLGVGNLYVVGLLGLVAAIAERGRVELRSGVSHSISLVPTLFAAVL